MWLDVLALLQRVPATFWGVVIGSVFTLAGVWGTNRAADRRFASQLAHDRDLKSRDRDLALRKEVYLEATEAVQAALISISKFANLDITLDKTIEDFVAKAAAIAKVNVVATVPTTKAMSDFMAQYTDATMRLMVQRLPISGKKVYVDTMGGYIAGWEKEASRWLEEIKQFNVAGVSDERRWKTLNGNMEVAQRNVTSMRADQSTVREEVQRQNMVLYESTVSESADLQKFIKPLLLAVRKELETGDDAEAFAAILEASNERNFQRTTQLVRELREMEKALNRR